MNKQPVQKSMDITASRPLQSKRRRRQFSMKQLAIGVGVLLIVMGLVVGAHAYAHRNEQRINQNGYQAVFLDDGKVFFGKLQNTAGQHLTLNMAYYPQEANQPKAENANASIETNSLQLIKMGDETYGPEGSMSIASDHVLFWQNLKSDSKVAKAINEQK